MLRPGFSSYNGASVLRTRRLALFALCNPRQGGRIVGRFANHPYEQSTETFTVPTRVLNVLEPMNTHHSRQKEQPRSSCSA